MKTFVLAALAVLILLPAQQGMAAPTPSNAALSEFFGRLKAGQKQTVVTYGTSLTKYGYWVTALTDWFGANYPGLVTVVNSGGPGQGSDWGVSEVKTGVLDQKPDLVFLEFAYNDAHTRKKITPEQSKANLDKIVRVIREQNPHAAIVLQTMNLPWDTDKGTSATDRPQLAVYNENYRAYAKENALPLVDNAIAWGELLKNDAAKYQTLIPDGSHPNKNGALLITWPAIQAFLEAARTGG